MGEAFIARRGTPYAKVVFDRYVADPALPVRRLLSAQPLSQSRGDHAAAAAGAYILFAGGQAGGVVRSSVDAYDEAGVRTSAPALSVSRYRSAGVSFGGKALFAGGTVTDGYTAVVDAYDESLTRTTLTPLTTVTQYCFGAAVGSYALIGPEQANVNVYDTSLIKLSDLTGTASYSPSHGCGVSMNGYAILGSYNAFHAFNSALIKTSLTTPDGSSVNPARGGAAGNGDLAVIGRNQLLTGYNTALVKSSLGSAGEEIDTGCSFGYYAVFAARGSEAVFIVDGEGNRSAAAPKASSHLYSPAMAAKHGLLLISGGSSGGSAALVVSAYTNLAQIPVTAGSRYNLGGGELTAEESVIVRVPQPVSGYIKYKPGTVTG